MVGPAAFADSEDAKLSDAHGMKHFSINLNCLEARRAKSCAERSKMTMVNSCDPAPRSEDSSINKELGKGSRGINRDSPRARSIASELSKSEGTFRASLSPCCPNTTIKKEHKIDAVGNDYTIRSYEPKSIIWSDELLEEDNDRIYYGAVLVGLYEIKVGDFVQVNARDRAHPSYVGRVSYMWEDMNDEQKYLHIHWFYRSTILAKMNNFEELFLSSDCDDILVSEVSRRIVVYYGPPSKWQSSYEYLKSKLVNSGKTFFYRMCFDSALSKFEKIEDVYQGKSSHRKYCYSCEKSISKTVLASISKTMITKLDVDRRKQQLGKCPTKAANRASKVKTEIGCSETQTETVVNPSELDTVASASVDDDTRRSSNIKRKLSEFDPQSEDETVCLKGSENECSKTEDPSVNQGKESQLNLNKECNNCSARNTTMWRRDRFGNIVCNACGLFYKARNFDRPHTLYGTTIRKRFRDKPSRKRGTRSDHKNINEECNSENKNDSAASCTDNDNDDSFSSSYADNDDNVSSAFFADSEDDEMETEIRMDKTEIEESALSYVCKENKEESRTIILEKVTESKESSEFSKSKIENVNTKKKIIHNGFRKIGLTSSLPDEERKEVNIQLIVDQVASCIKPTSGNAFSVTIPPKIKRKKISTKKLVIDEGTQIEELTMPLTENNELEDVKNITENESDESNPLHICKQEQEVIDNSVMENEIVTVEPEFPHIFDKEDDNTKFKKDVGVGTSDIPSFCKEEVEDTAETIIDEESSNIENCIPAHTVFSKTIFPPQNSTETKQESFSMMEPPIIRKPRYSSGCEEKECFNCHTQKTSLWRRDRFGNIICNSCGLYYRLHNRERPFQMRQTEIRRRNRKKKKNAADKTTPKKYAPRNVSKICVSPSRPIRSVPRNSLQMTPKLVLINAEAGTAPLKSADTDSHLKSPDTDDSTQQEEDTAALDYDQLFEVVFHSE